MPQIGFKTSSEKNVPVPQAINHKLLTDTTDKQAVKFANRSIRDAITALRNARRTSLNGPYDYSAAFCHLYVASKGYFAVHEMNPKESEISIKALKASLRLDRWMYRMLGKSERGMPSYLPNVTFIEIDSVHSNGKLIGTYGEFKEGSDRLIVKPLKSK